jgi:AcrR family transcriptional regulator
MTPKSEKKKELILTKAEEIFIKKGFTTVTMKDIIEESQISRGGIYVYFSSVDEIFKEVVTKHNKFKIDTVKIDIDNNKSFDNLVDTYFDGQKKRLLNMDKSLKTAMMEFFLAHKDNYSRKFILSQFCDATNMMLEILRYGVNYDKKLDVHLIPLAENVMLFIDGISTLSLLAGLSEELIDRQFLYVKKTIFDTIKSINNNCSSAIERG